MAAPLGPPAGGLPPPFNSQAPRCACAPCRAADPVACRRRAIPGKAGSHHRSLSGWRTLRRHSAAHRPVDQRGATGILGVMAARQAPPDGHTLVVVTTSTHGSMPALKRSLSYDRVKDFSPIVLMADAALVLLVRDDVPVRSVAQLVEVLRAKPGQLNYSTGGYGSPHHLATVTLFHRAGLPQNAAVHVPFAGLPPALMALLSGNAQFMITSTAAATPHIANGRLRPLATTGLKRSARLPDVPTMAELGYPGFEVLAWCGLAAPAGTPEAVISRWNELANAALRDPVVRDQISALDYEARGGTAREFSDFVMLDISRYKQLAQDMGLGED